MKESTCRLLNKADRAIAAAARLYETPGDLDAVEPDWNTEDKVKVTMSGPARWQRRRGAWGSGRRLAGRRSRRPAGTQAAAWVAGAARMGE